MFSTDTFLTVLYVTVDDFYRDQVEPAPEINRPGRPRSLSCSEVVTLALFSQLSRFQSERDFYRFAHQRLRPLFPFLPHRAQFNRLTRRHQPAILAFGLHRAQMLCKEQPPAYECLDRLGVSTRWCGRRAVGWLPDCADKGFCSGLGWFHGLGVLTCVSSQGIITGFGIAPASAKDQPLADVFLGARCRRHPCLPMVGTACGNGFYLMDKGFTGKSWHTRWREYFAAQVVCAPQADNRGRSKWPKEWRVWLASLRQVAETVHEKLLGFCRLEKERPHDLLGFLARLSAKVALHNFCFWLNRTQNRNGMAFADLIDW